MHITEIEAKLTEFVKTKNDKGEVLSNWRLTKCETITNLPRFIDAHLTVLKANPGNKLFRPYYDRLLKFVNEIRS